MAAGRPGELLYATMTDEFVARHADLHDRIGLFAERPTTDRRPTRPTRSPSPATSRTVELDRKRRALARHASQTGPLAALMGEDTYRTWWRTEWFRRPTEQEASSCARPQPTAGTGDSLGRRIVDGSRWRADDQHDVEAAGVERFVEHVGGAAALGAATRHAPLPKDTTCIRC